MRLTLQTGGGVAFFPGLARPVTVDTRSMAPEEAQALEALVARSGVLELAAAAAGAAPSAPPLGADRRVVRLIVESDGEVHRVELHEPLPAQVVPLVQAIRRLAR